MINKTCGLSVLVLLLSISLFAQKNISHNGLDEGRRRLMDIDREFSMVSKSFGVNKAFLSYVADDGVLLRKNNPPIVGKKTMQEKFFSRPDSGFTLTWEPLYADIAQSGELGYTFGIYEFKTVDQDGKQILENGTYVSIWKKDAAGSWKFVLDTGNEGLEPKNK